MPAPTPEPVSDAELARRLGLAVRRANTKRATPTAHAEVDALHAGLAARLLDGRPIDWATFGITIGVKPRRESGSVYRRPDGRFVAEVTINGTRTRRIVDTEHAGREFIAATTNTSKSGDREVRWTVEAWLRHVGDHVLPAEGLRPNSLAIYRRDVDRWLIPLLGRRDLAKLQPADVRLVITAMSDAGMSPNSVRLARSAFSALGITEREGLVVRNVARLVKSPPLTTTREPVFLDVAEAKALLAAAADDAYWGDAIALALLVGLRGELLGLRWVDVDLEAAPPTLRVVQQLSGPGSFTAPKTKAGRRTITLWPDVVTVLRRRRLRQTEARLAAGEAWTDSGLVFTTGVGTVLDGDNLGKAVVRLGDRVLGRHVHPHALRHSAATMMAAAGVPLKVRADHPRPRVARHDRRSVHACARRAADRSGRGDAAPPRRRPLTPSETGDGPEATSTARDPLRPGRRARSGRSRQFRTAAVVAAEALMVATATTALRNSNAAGVLPGVIPLCVAGHGARAPDRPQPR